MPTCAETRQTNARPSFKPRTGATIESERLGQLRLADKPEVTNLHFCPTKFFENASTALGISVAGIGLPNR